MFFLTDSELLHVYENPKSKKVHGTFGLELKILGAHCEVKADVTLKMWYEQYNHAKIGHVILLVDQKISLRFQKSFSLAFTTYTINQYFFQNIFFHMYLKASFDMCERHKDQHVQSLILVTAEDI